MQIEQKEMKKKTVEDMKAEIESIKGTQKQRYGNEILQTQSGTSEPSLPNRMQATKVKITGIDDKIK